MRGYLLEKNLTNNCGCKPRGKWKGVGKVSKTLYYRLGRNAQERGVPFLVTLEYISDLFDCQGGKCALTGLEIGFGKRTCDGYTASLDRIDSSLGYVVGNVWWVHKDINYMKMDLPLSRFKELCRLVIENV